jgi:glycerophosphoryl diester phosphodiesterase
MKFWLSWIAFGLAAVFLLLSVINASWLADAPRGGIKLIAHRAVPQLYDHTGLGRDSCTAERIEPPVHDYLENTTRSMQAATRLGADMVEIDIAPTADGKIAVFHDWTVDCRTNGRGQTRDLTLAQLQALDIGHGYTADKGRTFPFRGIRKDSMPSLEEALAALPNTSILFNFKSRDPREADLLAAALKTARRDVEELNDAFYGAQTPVDRIRHYYPDAWAWSMDRAKACTKDYVLIGWTSIVPESCRNGTLMIPVNMQWLMWGWPNRLIQRMEGVGARVIVIGPYGSSVGSGLTLPEQLGEIPSSFNGYIWAEDIWTIGPAFRPSRDMRTETQLNAANAGLARRRQAD